MQAMADGLDPQIADHAGIVACSLMGILGHQAHLLHA